MKSDAAKSLKQIQRVIQSLEERKLELIQEQFAVPLMEIVSIARDNDLSAELIAYALKQKAPRETKSVLRKNKRAPVAETAGAGEQ